MEDIRRVTGAESHTRTIVYAGLIAAAYYVLTVALAPVSFGPVQLRIAGLLMPAALLDRRYIYGLCIGLAMANLMSPFGWWDFAIMPIAALLFLHAGWWLRRWPPLALLAMVLLSAIAVAIFPLYFGGGIPIWPTVALIAASQSVMFYAGWYGIWRWLP